MSGAHIEALIDLRRSGVLGSDAVLGSLLTKVASAPSPTPVVAGPIATVQEEKKEEEKRESKRDAEPEAAIPAAAPTPTGPTRQSTLWDYGHGVAFKLKNGAKVQVHYQADMPGKGGRDCHIFPEQCKICLRRFKNAGGLAGHRVHKHRHLLSSLVSLSQPSSSSPPSTTTSTTSPGSSPSSTTCSSSSSSSSSSSNVVGPDPDDERANPSKQGTKRTRGANHRKSYTAAKKWVSRHMCLS